MSGVRKMRKTRDPIERFNEKHEKTASGCWEWRAGKKSNGYGQFTLNGKEDRAHRASYQLFVGPIPDSTQVLHRCDNPACVNPDHLFLGSVQDNMRDKVLKRRQRKGLNHPSCDLSESEVRSIKRLLSEGGMMQKDIAATFCVSQSTVSEIKHGKRFAEVA